MNRPTFGRRVMNKIWAMDQFWGTQSPSWAPIEWRDSNAASLLVDGHVVENQQSRQSRHASLQLAALDGLVSLPDWRALQSAAHEARQIRVMAARHMQTRTF
jgi:hypothetical protein